MTTFDELLAEGAAVPTEGWDFSWFAGRASEERPPWGYAGLVAQRSGSARAMLDVQTGGAEVLAQIPHVPPLLRATESWPPNLDLARPRLTALGGQVVQVEDTEPLPFDDGTFDLVVSRHPTVVLWEEIARVLRPGGTYLSQQVGKASVHELSEAMLGDFEPSDGRSPERAVAAAEGAGLRVRDLQTARLRMTFNDIAAVVHFLRKVIWIVPGFTVEAYRPQLELLHERIQAEGPFVAHSTRFLIEAGR
ncbi:class I SAM-dependent methyltransferase [Pseudactinotalea sp. Z1739]|uniref:class I SAM-dependent methyltransferase n=1 Tax=Pseudactinotalea sp. Z1739 TaxID=3413028 RepID=UPI003C7C8C57